MKESNLIKKDNIKMRDGMKILFLLGVCFMFGSTVYHSKWNEPLQKQDLAFTSILSTNYSNQKDEIFNCSQSENVKVEILQSNKIALRVEDVDEWEYIIVLANEVWTGINAISVLVNEVEVFQDSKGSNLTASTDYNIYIRAKCSTNEFSNWIGPINAKTLCTAVNTPFKENFDHSSLTFKCWTILDNNKDATSPTGNNIWKTTTTKAYIKSGDRAMQFTGNYNAVNDDWLISPPINLNGGIYAITYHYKTDSYYDNEFEVLLSDNGLGISNFKKVLVGSRKNKNDIYKEETIYINGISGEIYLAWHVTAVGATYIYLDEISVFEVDCIGPEDNIQIEDIEKDKAVLKWEDDENTSWEYHVQLSGQGTPVSSGVLTTSKKVKLDRTTGVAGASLEPNTEYEVYIRSNCGVGKKGIWLGPFVFRTECDKIPLPFWEGFNKNSKTLNCWKILDGNMDGTAYNGIWRKLDYNLYEGDQTMYFNGYTPNEHNDWLISPAFEVKSNRYYRLKYHYKTASYDDTEFEVLLSDSGNNSTDFDTVLVANKKYKNDEYIQEISFIGGVDGLIYIAWHVRNKGAASLYLDNIFLEEVETCPEPLYLDISDIEDKEATLSWVDEYGTKSWEYFIQNTFYKGKPNGSGGVVNKSEIIITKDSNGEELMSNTEYEFYVRSDCKDGEYSTWSGPKKFLTQCSILQLPYWEGFEDKKSFRCWDQKDLDGMGNSWELSLNNPYEGEQAICFSSNWGTANNWLISPQFIFEKNKVYRLKYHYKTGQYGENEFEVLVSDSGTDISEFKHNIVAKKQYFNEKYIENTVFITGLSGEVAFAWHIVGSGMVNICIDNIFIEEVATCPEPLYLGVKNLDDDKLTIYWDDDFNTTNWEYVVQKRGEGVPAINGYVTNNKEVIITKDKKGEALEPDTDYEFYVRASCGDGSFSIWAGPYLFTTNCGIKVTPFWEGFNSNKGSGRCWTILDNNNDGNPQWNSNLWSLNSETIRGVFEGDQSMYFEGSAVSGHDDWLISPSIVMEKESYVLKYHYKSLESMPPWYEYTNELEIVMSDKGLSPDNFNISVSSKKLHGSIDWKEEVVFFNGIKGEAYIGWHVTSLGSAAVYIDNIHIKKVDNCPEPFYVKVLEQDDTTIDIEWEQIGSISEWEVLIVGYNDNDKGVPIQKITVKGDSRTSLTGLESGRGYKIYVRAKCNSTNAYSDWSTPIQTFALNGLNSYCDGAIKIPVNTGPKCVQSLDSRTFLGSDKASAYPACWWGTDLKNIWFEFTAISETHVIELGLEQPLPIFIALYDTNCTDINSGISSVFCDLVRGDRPYEFEYFGSDKILLEDLTPGTNYRLRLAVMDNDLDTKFNICIVTPSKSIEISPVDDKYTLDQLIEKVLVQSECDLVSDIRSVAGGDDTETNTIGYFYNENIDFPFEEGIVLATHDVKNSVGPRRYQLRNKAPVSPIDPDLAKLVRDMGGESDMGYFTMIEFEFTPITDSISFEYLFASESYDSPFCSYACIPGVLFGTWLTDMSTGEGQNLAVVPGTNDPISLITVRNSEKSGALPSDGKLKESCTSINPEYYWKHYGNEQDNPWEAAINYMGLTKAMMSEKAAVIPGRRYKIKLGLVDYCPGDEHGTAVFFNARSFKLGDLNLGESWLVEAGTALCRGEKRVLDSGLPTSDELNMNIEWYRNGQLIWGENGTSLEIEQDGKYEIKVNYPDLGCSKNSSIDIEIYPPISEVVFQPDNISVCSKSLQEISIDLTQVEANMFRESEKEIYTATYFRNVEDAQAAENGILNVETYRLGKDSQTQTLYIRVENTRTGCHEIFELLIQPEQGTVPNQLENVSFCTEYVFPPVNGDQYYYTEPGGQGEEYKTGDVLTEPGEHTIYVLQINNEEGCYEEISYKVNITAPVTADIFQDKTLSCEYYELKPLSEHNQYFTEPGGNGDKLYPGMQILQGQTIYVYASSKDSLCSDESSFTIDYEDCPIPKGISPNNDGLNDAFDLTPHGVENIKIYNRWGTEVYSHGEGYTTQWHGQNKNGKQVPDGTYYYVIQAHGKTRTGWVQINK